ncbi:MAG TPA: serine/threonine-protein kinase [Polyangiaceae bacterium]|jgi:serine/threonine-protein kinase
MKDPSDKSANSEAAVKGASGHSESRKTPHRPGGPVALIGSTLSGRYRIDRLLGEGGMGAVYEAEHTHMRKRLAVKVLHPEMSRLPEVVARFEREAMAAAHIDHPNVAAATDFGKLEDGSFFLVLEFVEGHSLRDALAGGRLELGRALHVTHQIAAALVRAHALGIVHRDLKPENVMLVQRGGDADFVKVLDFGIAKVPVGTLASEEPAASAASGAPKILTQLGMVYGTPEYMAPEQALGQSVDARADLYSLGVMLYEMLAGSRPFDHESKVALLGMHVTARVPPFVERCPEALVPPEVEAIVMRLLKKESTDRYADAKELLEALVNAMALLIERHRIEPRVGGVSLLGAPASSSPNLASMLGPMGARMGSQVTVTSPVAARSPLFSAPGESGNLPAVRTVGGKSRLPAIIVAVLAVLSIGLIVVLSTHAGKSDVVANADGGTPVVATAVPTPEDDRITSALASIDKGDYGTGIAALTTLEPQEMGRADVHRALMKAYAATGSTQDSIREAGLLVKADPQSASDPKLLEDVRNAALGGGAAADEAFALLESSLGNAGPSILYEIAYTTWSSQYPAAATRAQKALGNPEVRNRGTLALLVALDLRAPGSCEKKKNLLPRASDVGDARALAILKAYVPTRGCGFLGARDCWSCMHKDGSLAKAIGAIEDRIGKK